MYGIYKKEVLMSSSKKEMDLTVGDPFRSLLKFAIPVILGNLFQLFYTLADTMIVEHSGPLSSTDFIYFVFCFYQRAVLPVASASVWGQTLRCQR